jgi:hypothetical protein
MASKKPQLSIIILTWNTANITKTCIRSINKYLNHKLDYEIILVDNASTDNTITLLKNEDNLTIVKNKENFGFSKGNNIGAKKAKADNLFFLNSDIELTDSNLVNMLKYFQTNPQIGLIGPKFLNPDLSIQGSVFPPQTALNAFKEYWLNQKNAYSKYFPTKISIQKVWSISGGAILIRKNIFNQIGGWDERYYFYYEDLELCQQIRKLYLDIIYYPKMKVIHRHGASGDNLTSNQDQWRRLIPSSKIYHGLFNHYLINAIIWLSQKLK